MRMNPLIGIIKEETYKRKQNGTNVFERQRQTIRKSNDEVVCRASNRFNLKSILSRGEFEARHRLPIYDVISF